MSSSAKRNSNRPGHGAVVTATRIWRITEAAPHGEFVDSAATDIAASHPPGEAEPVVPGWAMSSYELMRGLDVSEDSETVPAELFDKLFKR
jgi:hypothetical protein